MLLFLYFINIFLIVRIFKIIFMRITYTWLCKDYVYVTYVCVRKIDINFKLIF